MSLWSRIKGEFIDLIEWLDDSHDTLVYRYERDDNEIKYGAKLIVREGQAAVFINEGQLADVFGPGTFTLETKNLPVLSKLKGWKYGFESPFKAEVYFVSTRRFTDLKWGTKNPVMLRDAEFGPVRLRAFGSYALRVAEPADFIREIVGTESRFTTGEITDQLRNMIVSRFTDILAESKIPALDLAANYDELGEFVAQKLRPEFGTYGLELTQLLVENVSLPPAVEEALDKRTSMGVIGDLKKYMQYQSAEAMMKAAENPGGTAGAGIGMGMGFEMARQMGQALSEPDAVRPPSRPGEPLQGGTAQPPPLPGELKLYVAIAGAQAGPYGRAALEQKVRDGLLTRETLVWRQGMAQWLPAADVPEIGDLFSEVPPPLPGA